MHIRTQPHRHIIARNKSAPMSLVGPDIISPILTGPTTDTPVNPAPVHQVYMFNNSTVSHLQQHTLHGNINHLGKSPLSGMSNKLEIKVSYRIRISISTVCKIISDIDKSLYMITLIS